MCPLCGQTILTADDAEVDHVLAIAGGGHPHARDNLQLTHKACNRTKGAGYHGSGTTARANHTLTAQPAERLQSICWAYNEPECGTRDCRCCGHCPCDDPTCFCRRIGYRDAAGNPR